MIDLDTIDIENLNLNESGKSLLKQTVSRFKDLIKSTDELSIDDIKFYIETDPDKINSFSHPFHLVGGYSINGSNIKIFREPIKTFNGFFELKIKLLVSKENKNSDVHKRSIVYLEKYILLPII